MRSFFHGTQWFWIVVAGSAAAVGITVGVGVAVLRYVRSSAEVLQEAHRELQMLEETRHAVAEAETVFAGTEQERSLIKKSFADPADPLPFIEAIEELGLRVGTSLELNLASGGNDHAYAISARGSFANLLALLRSIEAFPFFVRIRDVAIVQTAGVATPTTEEAASKPREFPKELLLTLEVVSPE